MSKLNFNFTLTSKAPLSLTIQGQSSASIVGLLGDSGVGKTTMLRAIAGLEPSIGVIELDEHNIASLPVFQRPIAMVAQQPQLMPHWTIGEQLQRVRDNAFSQHINVDDTAKALGCGEFYSKYPKQLSGGQRQRAALLLALAREPRLLLLDEAFSGLDKSAKRQVFQVLKSVLAQLEAQTMIVSHQLQDIQALADDCWHLNQGALQAQGSMPEVLRQYQSSHQTEAFSSVLAAHWDSYCERSHLSVFILSGGQRVITHGQYCGTGTFRLAIHSDDLALCLEPVYNSSFANCLAVRVLNVLACDYGAQVFVQVLTAASENKEEFSSELVVQITRASLDKLPIVPGQKLHVLAKASAVSVLS